MSSLYYVAKIAWGVAPNSKGNLDFVQHMIYVLIPDWEKEGDFYHSKGCGDDD